MPCRNPETNCHHRYNGECLSDKIERCDKMTDKPKWWPENPYSKFDIGFLGWEKASRSIWNAMQNCLGNDEIMMAAIFDAVEEALDGEEPSDFMMSFPIVRKAWEVAQK